MNFMPARHIELPAAQRAKGALKLAFKRVGAATRIATLYQAGCLKTLLPRPEAQGTCDAVTINISGGIAGGDILSTSVTLQENTRVTLSSQAAERVYRALAEPAAVTTNLKLHEGAVLEYLPQETILFDRFGLTRSLTIDMHETASFLGVETLVFGRRAMGEIPATGYLHDSIVLRRNGIRILQDMTRLDGDIGEKLSRTAVANGATAMATIILATPDAPAKLENLRAALRNAHSGATAFENIVLIRILGAENAILRKHVISALKICRNGRPMPKAWQEGEDQNHEFDA
jgi:urease accessory protein